MAARAIGLSCQLPRPLPRRFVSRYTATHHRTFVHSGISIGIFCVEWAPSS